MTRATNARVAGFTFLFYIAVAFPAMIIAGNATGGQGTAAKLASVAQHASAVRLAIVLELLGCFCALVLAVTLYGITRDEDHELALLVLVFRAAEGVLGAIGLTRLIGLLRLATTGVGAGVADVATSEALGAFLLKVQLGGTGATFFAVGSMIFSYLLLRGRMVPVALAWLGVLASVLLVILLPAQLVGLATGPVLNFMWLPMLVFEVSLAVWLIVKGVATPAKPGSQGR